MTHTRLFSTTACAAAVALAAAAGSGCRSRLAPLGTPASGLLLPGSSLLHPPSLAPAVFELSVFSRQPADSIERRISHVTRSEHPAPGQLGRAVLASKWSPPFDSKDSVFVDRRTLSPISEALSFRGVLRRYQYAGRRVTGVVQYPDSAPRPYDHTFAEPVFAFNEVELLVRSTIAPGSRSSCRSSRRSMRPWSTTRSASSGRQPQSRGMDSGSCCSRRYRLRATRLEPAASSLGSGRITTGL